jgi:hypothetical protein
MEIVFWAFMAVRTRDLATEIRLASSAGHVRIIQLRPYSTDPRDPTRILPTVSPTVELIIITEYPID